MSDFLNRVTGLLVLEVINSNPNGDPDVDGAPRRRYDGRGEISPVSFKRKLRDLIEDKDGPVWCYLKDRLKLREEEYMILESRGRDRKEIQKQIADGSFKTRYWDGRIFGNTFLEDKMDKASIKSGVVQFGMGISISPIEYEAQTNTSKAGVQEGKNQGMAPMAYKIVTHGLYVMPFFVNPSCAHKSGCSAVDIEVMKELIPYAYSHNRSAIRPNVEVRQAWFCEHKNPLGSCSDFDLIEALTPKRKGDINTPSSSLSDYELAAGLPSSLKDKVICTNLIIQ